MTSTRHKRRYSTRDKLKIIKACQGKTGAERLEVLRKYGVPYSTLRYWIEKLDRGESLTYKHGGGRPSGTLRKVVRQEIKRALEDHE